MANLDSGIAIPAKLVSLINLHSSDLKHAMGRYPDNFVYGHQEILLKYMGFEFSTQILGVIEHGAPLPNFLEDVRSPRYKWGRKTKYWAWSKETESLALKNGYKNIQAIGSPWLYLKNAISNEIDSKTSRSKRFLVMPSHSVGNLSDVADSSMKLLRAQKFREAIGNQMATVCLHPADFCDPETRESFVKFGFDVTCIGSSLIQPPWSSSGNRVKSLYTLMNLMKNHTHFVTDHYGTAIFYAIDLGLEIAIFPEIKQFQNLDFGTSGNPNEFEARIKKEIKFLLEFFPAAINNFTLASKYTELSSKILGKDCIMSPTDLKQTLVLRHNVYRYNSNVQPW